MDPSARPSTPGDDTTPMDSTTPMDPTTVLAPLAGRLAAAMVTVLLLLVLQRMVRRLRDPFGDSARRAMFDAIPGFPVSFPLLGDLPNMILGKSAFRTGLAMFRFGPTFRFWCGNIPFVVLSRPEDYEVIAGSGRFNNKPRHVYSTVETFFGSGLATLNGDVWKLHRKHITHAFHFRILENYVEVFDRKARMLSAKLRPLADGSTTINMFPQFAFVTNETIFETAFGLDEDANRAVDPSHRQEFVEAMEFAFGQLQERIFKPWLLVDWIYWLTADGRRFFDADRMIDEFAGRVIQDRRAKLQQNGGATEMNRHSFLDLLMKLEPSEDGSDRVLNDAEIRGELRTFISVQQTSATIMSFVLILLALHPDAQERVLEEVVDELGVEGGIQYSSLMGLKFLERVIKETMRMFPVLPVMGRECHEDVKLTDCTIPAGCCIGLATVYTHRLPNLWDHPDTFDPDRFLPHRSEGRHPYSYLPFSAGGRNCIGQKYAMLQMKAVLSTLLRHFEILPGKGCASMSEMEANVDVTTFLTMPRGFNIRLRPRDPSDLDALAASLAPPRFSQQLDYAADLRSSYATASAAAR